MNLRKVSIKFLILSLIAFAMIGTILGSIISSVIVSKGNLENNYLIENQYHAEKLADTTDLLFHDMFQNLRSESKDKSILSNDTENVLERLTHVLNSTNYFNSVIFVNRDGYLVADAPGLGVAGSYMDTIGPVEALEKKEELASDPYTGIIDKLMILISVPVFDDNGDYAGFLGGTIYLEEKNSLQAILGQHPEHQNGSYVFVVDTKGNIIYHPDPRRINDNVLDENEMVQQVVQGKTGNQEVVNSKGISMLAGHATSQSAKHWGIVSQTPKEALTQPTMELIKQIGIVNFPIIILIFLLSYFQLNKVINPIRDLAFFAKQITERKRPIEPKIPDYFYELVDLKKAIFIAMDYYQEELQNAENKSILDPLTSVFNRRALDNTLHDLDHYSIILFDIDDFKQVNDRYGHQVGDEVLIFLTQVVQTIKRQQDVCFRLGGDEFLIVLPHTNSKSALAVAEEIKSKLDLTNSPTGGKISISIGVGDYPNKANSYTELYKAVDEAQYKAKQSDKNKIQMAKTVDY